MFPISYEYFFFEVFDNMPFFSCTKLKTRNLTSINYAFNNSDHHHAQTRGGHGPITKRKALLFYNCQNHRCRDCTYMYFFYV